MPSYELSKIIDLISQFLFRPLVYTVDQLCMYCSFMDTKFPTAIWIHNSLL